MRLVTLLIAWLTLGSAAIAGPWIDPGDSGLRHDIQVLADAGVISGPVSTWPLSWGDIKVSLDGKLDKDLAPDERAALKRVRWRMRKDTRTGEAIVRAHVSAAGNPREIRTFEDGPRENGEIGAGLEWTGNRFAARLQGAWVNDPDDNKDWRADGSYLGMALGNWMIAASTSDRYWGPGWQSSMILSNNARPIPSFTLERNLTTAYKSKWLRWIGPWDLAVMWGFLDDDRTISSARVFAIRYNFRPIQSLEVAFSGMGLWCGSGQDCSADELFDLVTGSGSAREYDRLMGYDMRWSHEAFGRRFALYTHWVGEDFGDGSSRKIFPAKLLGQFGAETWGHSEKYGDYRFYLEWVDTECDFSFYRKISFDGGGGIPGCGYRNQRYKDGQTYRGRSYAHSFDQDSSAFSFGAILNDRKDRNWLLTLTAGKLNRRGENRNVNAENETDYGELEISNSREFWVGDLTLGLGYEYRKDTVTNDEDNDVRAFLEWGVEY